MPLFIDKEALRVALDNDLFRGQNRFGFDAASRGAAVPMEVR